MRIIRNLLLLIFFLFSFDFLNAGTLFNLPNPIGTTAFGKLSNVFFVGSAVTSSNQAAAFSIAVAGPGSTSFAGITPENIFIQGKEQANPLYGAHIRLLATTGRKTIETDGLPLVVIENDRNHAYVITSYMQSSNPALVISSELKDTTGAPASSIDAIVGSVQGSIFAAISPQGGAFGDAGGGIALADLLTTQSGDQITFGLPASVDVTSWQLRIGSALQSLTNPSLYVSSYKTMQEINVGTLFAGFNAIGGPNSTDGVIGVLSTFDVVGSSALTLNQIVPPTAVAQDSIIAGTGANTQVTIHFLSTLLPSVGTQYLVVVGGVGLVNEQPINVYALPLTSRGSLASVNAAPQTNSLTQRQFIVPATQQGDLYTPSSTPAIVGGGSAPGIITSLYTAGDSVIITVTGSADQAAGIFYSQAIFDSRAVISGWTDWQRAVNTQGIPENAIYDRKNSQFWYSTALTSSVQSVVATSWEKNGTQLGQLLNNTLPQAQGGIQGVIDLPATSLLFSQSVGSRSSVSIFTGFNTVTLAETARDIGAVLSPVTVYPDIFMSADGTLNSFASPAEYISITGGVLNDLKAIIAGAVVSCGGNSWIVVGGNGGLAVLALSDGTGIPNESISQNFAGLSDQLTWQKLGNYSNVRKLIAQNGSLYILTDTLFERVRLTPEIVNGSAPLNSVTLAIAQTLPNKLYFFFSDVVVSEPLVILATSSGLLRSGDGVSVATALNQDEIHWQEIIMPENTGCATRLWPITQTGIETDLYTLSPGVSGNLYVLSGNVSRDQARMYRYVINYDSSGITGNTVQLFNDFFITGRPTFFVNIGSYRNFFYTDGMLWSISRSRYLLEKLFVQSLPAELQQGFRMRVPQNVGFYTETDANSVGQLLRISGLGSWVIPGDFGLVVHQ
ncbi:MAG: hypothetical protein K2X90_04125 [Candidatus Babeliaceae bacterium]|nr:hypothetical protein [Candidatus Babeliaceae bacterium]